QLILFMTL
ncbi:hypothetical protein CLOP_g18171, partial [Closterium sp. NIES-67]